MEVLTGLTQSVKADNEDGFGFDQRQLWVVDAATPLEPHEVDGKSAAAWLRERACARLAEAPWQAPRLDQTLAWLIEQLATEGRERGLGAGPRFPSGAVALVRQRDEAVDVCLLGDITIVVSDPSGSVIELLDPQFTGTESAVLADVAGQLAAGHEPAEVYRRTNTVLRARREQRNTERGLWVLSGSVEAAGHAFLATVATPPGSNLLAATDGFMRLVDPFAVVPDPPALLDEVATGRAADLLAALRAAEAADPACVRFPRFGASDDATVVHAVL